MENFCLIHICETNKLKVYLNFDDTDVLKKFREVHKGKATNKFAIVIEAIKHKVATTKQFNWESKCEYGDIYAIKVDEHRFYTLYCINDNYRELYICRYGKKESQANDKKLTDTINSIGKITIQKLLQ